MVVWICGAVLRGFKLTTEVYSYLLMCGKNTYLNHKWIFFSPCIFCKDSSAASLIYSALVHTVTSTGAERFCCKNHRNAYHVLWLIQVLKAIEFTSTPSNAAQDLILLNFRHANIPTRKIVSAFCSLESGHLARLKLKKYTKFHTGRIPISCIWFVSQLTKRQ